MWFGRFTKRCGAERLNFVSLTMNLGKLRSEIYGLDFRYRSGKVSHLNVAMCFRRDLVVLQSASLYHHEKPYI